MSDIGKLKEIITRVYERRRDEIRVSPSWLATEAMAELDADRLSPPLVYLAAHLELRQIARLVCRSKWEPDDDATGEHDDLFPDLQPRYPVSRPTKEDPEYVLRDHMTEEDVMANYHRMYAEAETKTRRADALFAWWQNRKAA